MNVIATIFPVLFMLFFGLFSNKKQLISNEQVEGLSTFVFKLLVPIMVFNAIFTTSISVSDLLIVVSVFIGQLLAIIIGKISKNYVGGMFSHLSPYLMVTVDGGSIVLPLYATIVGASFIHNIVLLDIAGMFIIFLVIPLLVSTSEKKATSVTTLLKSLATNPIVITLLIGLALNTLGLYSFLESSGLINIYTSTINMAIGPVVGSILFILGYQFELNKQSIGPVLKSLISRILIMSCIIFALFTLFPHVLED